MIEVKGLNGKLNTDSNQFRMPPNDFIDALNITRNNLEVVYNIPGNQVVVNPYLHNSGVNKRIGSYSDVLRNRIYQFIWNSLGFHLICYYDGNNNSFVKLFISKTDSDSVDILAWNPSYRINHIDIIYRDEGDLVFWTEGLNRPMFINETDARNGLYGSSWQLQYLTVNRPMPLVPAVGTYANDSTYNICNLYKKVYEFRYRWVYRNFEKSAWSPYSKIPCPVNPDDIAVETDPTKNNRIDILVTTGRADVIKIEIAARIVIAPNLFSDDFLITTVSKSENGIGDNSNYSYAFYNSSTYPTIDPLESTLLYSWVPRKAYTQVLGNGNIPIYGATTEGYNKEVVMDVTSSVTTYLNSSSAPLTYWDRIVARFYEVYLLGSPNTGDTIGIHVSSDGGDLDNFSYAATAGQTNTDMRNALVVLINASTHFTSTNVIDANGNPGLRIDHPSGSEFTTGTTILVYSGTPTVPPTEIGFSCYRPNSRQTFALVYFDEFGENPGAITQSTMSIITAEVDTTGQTQSKISAINFSINHQPPTWAKSFAFLRAKNATAQSNLYVVTADTQKDSGTPVFGYLNIINQQNNNNGLPIYTFTEGDRVRLIKGKFTDAFTSVKEFPIIDFQKDMVINGSATTDAYWLKIPYTADMVNFGVAGNEHWLIEIFTPAINYSAEQTPFFEFGEFYGIGDAGLSTRYHMGQIQNQIVGVQPAKFSFSRGDFYVRQRNMSITKNDPSATVTYWIFDQSFSDKFGSKTDGNGRVNIIDPNAKETYFPAYNRFGGAYQSGTNINQTNIFYPDNYDEYDRSLGSIRKMFIEGRRLFVFQQFDIGVVPIYTQIVRDTTGNPLEANSDQLLNKITYPFKGKHGIGDVPESFSYSDGRMYFADSNLGVICRIGGNGLEELSVVYKMNSYFIDLLAAYGKGLDNGIVPAGETYTGNPTVYGGFNNNDNKYIMAFEEINRYVNPTTLKFHQDPVTISFFETTGSMQGFESKFSYHPEGLQSLNNLFVTWKNGALWLHNWETYNNFYGVGYNSSITPVFNKNEINTETFTVVEQISSGKVWDCPEIITASNEYGSTKQTSSLIARDFEQLEGKYTAGFLCASNSLGGLINGSSLKGNLCSIKFRALDPENLVTLELVIVKSINSSLNLK